MIEEKLFKKYLLLLPKEVRESVVLDDECKLLLGVLRSWSMSQQTNAPSVAYKQLMKQTNTDLDEVALNLKVLISLGYVDGIDPEVEGHAPNYRLTWLTPSQKKEDIDEEDLLPF